MDNAVRSPAHFTLESETGGYMMVSRPGQHNRNLVYEYKHLACSVSYFHDGLEALEKVIANPDLESEDSRHSLGVCLTYLTQVLQMQLFRLDLVKLMCDPNTQPGLVRYLEQRCAPEMVRAPVFSKAVQAALVHPWRSRRQRS